ncbi:N-acetylmuramic acid 6-phosphate etherase [Roseibaca sp. Y0-43]|uniref:N-acetylmuramic acid 6-phosphate etherase n=1 Tax=Roseibaca sp. Y0-43 TaxID=2816854 RepID=UPI001D0C6EE3|nr:N-acetylmuramic acid 6-phosphate etherase [Roseibaca sp. Y0-43]MCC1482469.1 N-acetylmuramic acid 6-phosphate etherase [Roseibaca sp. Y0-43]
MTEYADPRYREIDTWDDATALRAMLEGQMAAIAAIAPALPAMADVVAAAVPRLRAGGRLVYAGAGTSIRVAVQDGIELGPTYDWPESRTLYLIAGGEQALMLGIEGAEDNAEDGRAQVAKAGIGPVDVVIGLAASGRTPFTVAVLDAARAAGALTVGISCNPGAPICTVAEHGMVAETGAEAVAGSTRMKAGTAQKAILNLLSTQIMLRLGHVHRGLMVNMRPQNIKLRGRATGMVARLAQVDNAAAQAALEMTGWKIKPAVLVAQGYDLAAAHAALDKAQGVLRHVDGARV